MRSVSASKLHRADEGKLMQHPPGPGELPLLLSFGSQLLNISSKSGDTMKDISKFLVA